MGQACRKQKTPASKDDKAKPRLSREIVPFADTPDQPDDVTDADVDTSNLDSALEYVSQSLGTRYDQASSFLTGALASATAALTGGSHKENRTDDPRAFSPARTVEEEKKREEVSLSARLDAARKVYENLDISEAQHARAQLAEIDRARQLLDDDTARYQHFLDDTFQLSARSNACNVALRAETMYIALHRAELERLEESNVDLLAETVVYYDVLPRVYCDARRDILEHNQKLIGTKKQQLFWHQSKLLHYEALVEKQERRIDNVIVMARYLQDHASDQGYLLWAEKFRKLRDMARYIDSLRFETDDLRSELSYLVDLNRVQLEEFGAKRLGAMLQTVGQKLTNLQDALRRQRQRRQNDSIMRSACQTLAQSVYAPRKLPRMQLEFLDSQIEVCVKLAKLFALVSDNQRLRLKTRNAQMLAKIVSLCRKHNTPPTVWRETAARVRNGLESGGMSSAWATFSVYDGQVRRAAAAGAAAKPLTISPATPASAVVHRVPLVSFADTNDNNNRTTSVNEQENQMQLLVAA